MGLAGSRAAWLAGWRVGWLAGWLAGWLVSWLAGCLCGLGWLGGVGCWLGKSVSCNRAAVGTPTKPSDVVTSPRPDPVVSGFPGALGRVPGEGTKHKPKHN